MCPDQQRLANARFLLANDYRTIIDSANHEFVGVSVHSIGGVVCRRQADHPRYLDRYDAGLWRDCALCLLEALSDWIYLV